MIDETDIFNHAALALRQAAVKGVESFVSNAVGEAVQITSGPAGQVVVGPQAAITDPTQAPASAGKILLPLLIGAGVLVAINALGGGRK